MPESGPGSPADACTGRMARMNAEQRLRSTEICRLLGIEYPILQAGMGQVAYGALAAAVSEAGGLGVIGSGYLSGEELRQEIRIVRERTRKPFGVDILFAATASTSEESLRYTNRVQEQIDVTLEEKVPVLISGLGNPLLVIEEAHRRGMKVMSVVGNAKQARRLAGDGVDAVIASGHEGGGHVGRVGTMVLVPQVVDAVKVPVVAGGGLADGRGLVAALALGACGVWMGTRFIATKEARAHEHYKQKLVDIDEEGTIVTRAHSGKTCRLVRNQFTDYWAKHEGEIAPYPHQLETVGAPASVRGRIDGDIDNGSLPAGQGAALIHSVPSAGDV